MNTTAKRNAPTRDEYGIRQGTRYVDKDKEAIILLVRSERITREGAIQRYLLSDAEFTEWETNYDRFGLMGLRPTRMQNVQPRRLRTKQTLSVGTGHPHRKAESKRKLLEKAKPILSLSDIPQPDVYQRYTSRIKEAIVHAIDEGVKNSVFTLEDALAHCHVDRDEYDSWVRGFDALGRRGLLVMTAHGTRPARRVPDLAGVRAAKD